MTAPWFQCKAACSNGNRLPKASSDSTSTQMTCCFRPRFLIPQTLRIILRNLERRPVKAALSVLGIAMSIAVLILGGFMLDALNYLMDFQFRLSQRQDVSLTLIEPRSHKAIHEIEHLPGVMRCQPFRMVPVQLSYSWM